MAKKAQVQYYCLAVRRNYETVWRVIGKYETQEEAQVALDERRAYVGAFNYDNAELRVISRDEGKQMFGADWEYHPIGETKGAPAKPKRVHKNTEDF